MGDGSAVGIGQWNEAYVGGNENVNNTIINNIVYNSYRSFYYYGATSGLKVDNNIFADSQYFAGVQLTADACTDCEFKNNIIVQDDSLQPIYYVPSGIATSDKFSFGYNLYNKSYSSNALGNGDKIGDPKFAKVGSTGAGQLTGDYFKLLTGSPAIDAGVSVPKVIVDYFGAARDSKPNIGAIEGGSVLGASTYHFSLDLKYGDKSDEVKVLQNLLFILNYLKDAPTGYFGPATEAALKQYQKANSLNADGIIGAKTREMLNKDSEEHSLYY